MSDLRSLTTWMVLINVFVLFPYVPRVLRIYLSFKELKKRPLTREIRETPIWIKCVLNFYMYLIASHVAGALWYFFAIQRMMICWHSACRKNDECDNRMFGCHDHHFFNTTILNDLCPVNVGDNSSDTMFFDFGIFATVLKYGVVGSTSFKKFLICFGWGLRNLSSFGSNLEPSADGWENVYTNFISVTGLLLFLYLIGNFQMYMQYETTRREDHKRKMLIKQKVEEKGRDIELWLFKRGVPTRLNKNMKLLIMEKVQALEEGMEISLDNILHLLPSDVQSRIEDYMPLAKLKQVPVLRGRDEDVLKIICQKLEPVRYTDNSFIIQKGEPLQTMLYIVDGFVSIEERSCDSDGSQRGAGELYGEELLRWLFFEFFPSTKPCATESVKAIGVVEALVLKPWDLESMYMQFETTRREDHKRKMLIKQKMEEKGRDIDLWLLKRGVPTRLNKDMKLRIMEKVQQALEESMEINLDNILPLLPSDVQSRIEDYMPLAKLKQVPVLRGIDEDVLKIICQKLEPVRYTDNSLIIQKGEPLQTMLYIVDGFVSIEERSCDSDGSQRGAGELYGEELLRWLFFEFFPSTKPCATESVKAIGVVEALVLKPWDLESMYMQFETTRREVHKRKMLIKQKTEEKGRDIDLWLLKRGVPTQLNKDVKLQIMENVQQALEESMEINLDNILPLLPSDVQSRIEDYMPLEKLKEVPMFRGIDEDVLKIICQKLEPVRYTDNSFIIQKGEPLDKMVYIVDGFVSIEERSSDDSRRGLGELCGQELLRWPFSTDFPYPRPLATESVKAIGVVEALALNAQDLQSIYHQLYILEKEKPRHRRMIKEEIEQNIDGLIRRNGIPERLNQDVTLRIMKELFQENKAVYWDRLNGDYLISCLPRDFQDEIKSYMPLTKLKKMPAFQYMDDKVLKEICSHLRPMKYNRTNNIIEKGDPIQMLVIVEGRIGQEGWVKNAGEIYGEELLVWPFSTSFPDRVPTAVESPFLITDVVEALVLTASDMESVATEFRKHFIKNYGRFVEKFSTAFLRFFTEEEVKRATSDYTCLNYPKEEGYGTVYHTELGERAVAIKTCNNATGDPFIQSQRLVHEAFVLLRISHSNVESLFGCCLETRWPIMVYDRNNALTLVEHFHRNKSKLSLESRMKIAEKTAYALAHLHSELVIHRDVRTANILIDRTTHTVKVSGYGASRLLDEDEGEMEDEVSTLPGTLGYLDPEYLESHVLTKKSDVYSFGVVLVELLTRQEAVSSDGSETSLANDFARSVQEDRLGQILDGEINRDKFSFEIAKKASKLAVKCLRSRGEERPSMGTVAAELDYVCS